MWGLRTYRAQYPQSVVTFLLRVSSQPNVIVLFAEVELELVLAPNGVTRQILKRTARKTALLSSLTLRAMYTLTLMAA